MFYLFLYILWALFFFVLGFIFMNSNEETVRAGSLTVVLSPVWPVLIIFAYIDSVRYLNQRRKNG